MMFDVTLRIGEPMVQTMADENGDSYELQIVAPVLMLIPVGPGQFAPIQTGVLKLPMEKLPAANLADALREGADQIKNRPEVSDIAIVGSMTDAERIAQEQRKFNGPA